MAKYNKRIWDSKNKKYIEPDEPKRSDPKPRQLKEYEAKETEEKGERKRLEAIQRNYIKTLNEKINSAESDKEAEKLIKKRDRMMKSFAEDDKRRRELFKDE